MLVQIAILWVACILIAAPGAVSVSSAKQNARDRELNLESLVIERVAPLWPTERGIRVRGDVVVRITLNAQGILRSARVVTGHPLKRGAAINAIRKWRFNPFIKRGKAHKVTGLVKVRFPE